MALVNVPTGERLIQVAHIVAGMNKKGTHCMLRPSFKYVLPCILTTSSTSREISLAMIISIALKDYSDRCLKSLNCNSTQKKSSAAGEACPISQGKVYLLPFVQFGHGSMG